MESDNDFQSIVSVLWTNALVGEYQKELWELFLASERVYEMIEKATNKKAAGQILQILKGLESEVGGGAEYIMKNYTQQIEKLSKKLYVLNYEMNWRPIIERGEGLVENIVEMQKSNLLEYETKQVNKFDMLEII